MKKPDFVIIGAMKSATTTLHMQLSLQEGIYMSTPKEPNYFSDDEEYARGEQWYNSLFFNAKASDICGESSTHYTKLPDYPLTVERIAKQLKKPKFIYVMRDPIDRLVSHYIHQWSKNEFKCDINQAIDQYEELIAYSCYARQLDPYFQQFGHDSVLPVFNEAIRINPQEQLQRVADFIGYSGVVTWQSEAAAQNISSDRVREFKGYPWLIGSNIMTYLRRLLVPQAIRNRVKRGLTIQNRPVISNIQLEKLMGVFDADLKILGELLGIDLSCENFVEQSKQINHSWKP